MVTVCVLAQPSQRELLAPKPMAGVKTAEAWKDRNRETFRDALNEDEAAFCVLVLDADGLPLKCWEHPRVGWGPDGIETGRRTLREMQAAKAAE